MRLIGLAVSLAVGLILAPLCAFAQHPYPHADWYTRASCSKFLEIWQRLEKGLVTPAQYEADAEVAAGMARWADDPEMHKRLAAREKVDPEPRETYKVRRVHAERKLMRYCLTGQ